MKKTLIPMMLVAATILSGCKATIEESTVSVATIETSIEEKIDETVTTVPEITPEETAASSSAIEEEVIETSSVQTEETTETVPETKATEPKTTTNKKSEPSETAAESRPTETTMSMMASALVNYPSYYALVNDVKAAVTSHSKSLGSLSPSIEYYGEVNSDGKLENKICVTLFDINDDTVPELFFTAKTANSKGTIILDMYTLINGSAVKIISREYYESYAYMNGVGIIHEDDTQIIDVLSFDGTSLQVTASYGPDDNYSYNKDAISGTTSILSEF